MYTMGKKIEDWKRVKDAVHTHCVDFINERLKRVQLHILELEHALTSETKSSAGDKHETGRAMIQLEREKLGQQLSELEKTQQLFARVPKDRNTKTIGLGNLVVTETLMYYIAISAGECIVQKQSVYCISAVSPIGQLLMDKSVGYKMTFNGKTATILGIY